MVRAHVSLVVVFGLAGIVGACAEASSDTVVGGGPRFEPVSPPGPTSAPPAGDGGAGTTFTDLYRDFFGPTAAASCSGGLTACHGAKTDPGGGVFVCAGDKAECRTGLAALASGATFKDSLLFDVLRKEPASGQNRMPKAPKTYTFDQAAIDRIAAWVAAGAKDD